MKLSKALILGTGLVILASACTHTNHSTLYQDMKSVDKLVFASMAITKTAVMESSDWYTIGKRIAAYSYDTYMQAYIDLSTLEKDDIVFDDDAKTVRVTLPPIVTEVTGRDIEMRKEYENIGLMRSDLDSKERAEMKEKANASFKKEIEENSAFKAQLIEAAQRKARKYFQSIFETYGYTAEIDFKTSN